MLQQLPVSAENATRAMPSAPAAQQQQQQVTNQLSQMNLQPTPSHTPTPAASEKKSNIGYYAENPAPPAYPSAPAAPMVLTYATALYQYNAQDAGDLALSPNDKIAVTEYMNAEWWKGKNERSGAEGIFPASYVRKEEKAMGAPAPSNYGNMPLDVSNGAASSGQAPAAQGEPSKLEAGGKKFGKKLGNAAIFGAGASIGGKIVNGIF